MVFSGTRFASNNLLPENDVFSDTGVLLKNLSTMSHSHFSWIVEFRKHPVVVLILAYCYFLSSEDFGSIFAKWNYVSASFMLWSYGLRYKYIRYICIYVECIVHLLSIIIRWSSALLLLPSSIVHSAFSPRNCRAESSFHLIVRTDKRNEKM